MSPIEKVDMALDMSKELYREDLPKLQKMACKLRQRFFGDRITFYTRPFTPVSVTGTKCDLSCKHCDKHYLKHMEQAHTKKELAKTMKRLARSGEKGVVLSGGGRPDGSVPTYEFAPELKKIKKETGLIMNAHTGIVTKKQARTLAGFLDAALTDVIGDRETVKEVLGLDYGPEDYANTLKLLRDAGVKNISPHVIVGLHHGKTKGELAALNILKDIRPENIVIVVFIPTKGTPMEKDKPPEIEDVSKLIALARILHPETNISLSCVRPGGRYRTRLDAEAVKSGINKMALPSKSAYKTAEELGLEMEEIKEPRCCSWQG
ncbi:MAG: radical SAM protein [Candidatus Altiarchaeota archaeon]|nr:radical SAM protein [Candidatus Altiarchaeota archaeon]